MIAMQTGLDPVRFLELSRHAPVVDVRTQAEFSRGHVPGAVNLPLFSNEERATVGTLYTTRGSAEAIKKGLELVKPKIRSFMLDALKMARHDKALLYCWRGGMRSNSMAWLFNSTGIRVATLEGGYKAYRRFVHDCFARPFRLVVIGGMTGSGKTAVLEAIEKMGMQVIHLERLANHRGSVFGGIDMPEQPTTEHFENLLCAELLNMDAGRSIFLEDESLAIGKVFIPGDFFRQMSRAGYIRIDVPFSQRVRRLEETYARADKMLLVTSVNRLERRLGHENTRKVIRFIENNNMTGAVELVLKYYDKVYARSQHPGQHQTYNKIIAGDEKPDKIATRIVRLSKEFKSL
jgi:tRNA 2-selenouridine synthase